MGDEQKTPRTPQKFTPLAQGLQIGLPIGVGLAVGRVAGDAVRDSLGWWGSVGVGTLAAMLAAIASLLIVLAWQRRGSRAEPIYGQGLSRDVPSTGEDFPPS